MGSPTPRRTLVTEEEFLALPESTQLLELIDGEVIVPPSPTFRHQEVQARLLDALRPWAGSRDELITVGHSPTDVRFAKGRILQPDVFVILDGVSLDTEGPIDRVPELCIEVLSSNRVHDRVTKRTIYAESGVAEYWTVEPLGPVEVWTGPGLSEVTAVGDRLTSPLLPGFELHVPSLFAP